MSDVGWFYITGGTFGPLLGLGDFTIGTRRRLVTVLAGVLPLRVPAHAGGGSASAGSGANRTVVLIRLSRRLW